MDDGRLNTRMYEIRVTPTGLGAGDLLAAS